MAPRHITLEEADLAEAAELAVIGELGSGVRQDFAPRGTVASDPSQLGWPPTLPIELALRTGSVKAICEAHGIELDEWLELKGNVAFVAELKKATESVRREGAGFKAKAGLQAMELLKTSWAIIHDRTTPASVRADLISKTVRWAGLDASKDQGAGKTGPGFQITLNLA